jgi:hypothetical protein
MDRKVVGVLIAALAATAAPAASAETLTVTRFDDPLPNGCAAGDCSLREAAIVSNTDPADKDVISLAPGTYSLSIAGPGGFQGDLDLSSSVDIVNTGIGAVTIDANGDVTGERAIEVLSQPPGTVSVALHDISIASGIAPLDGENFARGGGVRVNANTSFAMRGGRLSGNAASIRPSAADALGGGLYVEGFATLDEVEVAGNEADSGGGIAASGGILNILNSRVGRNVGADDGGALYADDDAELSVHNSTLDSNQAGDAGGGIMLSNANAVMNNTTIARNRAGLGGGVIVSTTGLLRPANSIIASNIGTSDIIGRTHDCFATSGHIQSLGHNLLGDAGPTSCMDPDGGDLIGGTQGHPAPIEPRLGPSGRHGGPTTTISLKSSSPAVDAGNPGGAFGLPDCQSTDARGVPRALGGRCDMGAYELTTCSGVVVNRVATDGAESASSLLLTPTMGADGILALGGEDSVTGASGADGLCGGLGNDRLSGEAGNDRLVGGPGRDICIGGPGNDTATGCELERSIP